MVFTVNSNEHTQKVCLSSRLAENYPSVNPKFMLRTPIKSPWNIVSMVCLESAILEAPSLFTYSLINNLSNACVRIIDRDEASAYETLTTRQDYWNDTDHSVLGV